MRISPVVAVGVVAALVQIGPFEPVQPALLSAGGALVNAWADGDGDGDLDLLIGFNGAPNRFYRNDEGTLVETAAAAGLADARATRASAWGDYDRDDDPDLLVGFAPGDAPILRLYRNDDGRFTDVTTAAGIDFVHSFGDAQFSTLVEAVGSGTAWLDYDQDGRLDLYLATGKHHPIVSKGDPPVVSSLICVQLV